MTSALDSIPSAAFVATGLVGGYGVASTTKNRPLGGAVLAPCGVLAGRQWARHGVATTAGLSALYIAAFAGSHPLAKKMGAWPSVFTVTGAAAATTWALADRR